MHALPLGGLTALFCSRRQRLFELNATASELWRALAQGVTCARLAEQLRAEGVDGADADAFVAAVASEWLKKGYLVPTDAYARREGAPDFAFDVGLGPLRAELRFFGGAGGEAARDIFGHLRALSAAAKTRIDIVALEQGHVVFLDGAPRATVGRVNIIPQIKALLTERYLASVEDGFLAHGALVAANGKHVFLSGKPGAGKTTLTLALCACGFAYGGDDTVHIHGDGRASGAPFAAGVKSGAWNLLESYAPGLAELATHVRPDGQSVRYYLPDRRDISPAPIDVVLDLDRRAGVRAQLAPLQPLEAMCLLLRNGYAERGGIDATTLEALAPALSGARCATLIYDDLPGAVALIQRMTNE